VIHPTPAMSLLTKSRAETKDLHEDGRAVAQRVNVTPNGCDGREEAAAARDHVFCQEAAVAEACRCHSLEREKKKKKERKKGRKRNRNEIHGDK